jgi:hypothetical protein
MRARAFTRGRAIIFAFTRERAKERGGGKKERRCEPAARTKVGLRCARPTLAHTVHTRRRRAEPKGKKAGSAAGVTCLTVRRRGDKHAPQACVRTSVSAGCAARRHLSKHEERKGRRKEGEE